MNIHKHENVNDARQLQQSSDEEDEDEGLSDEDEGSTDEGEGLSEDEG